ncbi:MAG: hypothetical protein NTU98_15445 [Bacteroidetes bacterium]|nr:hypothetical protein [Bacteroidota bacterium]
MKCFNPDNKEHFLKFLKNSMIEFASVYHSLDRIGKIFSSLETIIEKAKVNFEVYLNNLSIDKFKKNYEEVRSRYFEELSKILSDLTQKILGLPVGIAASLFALENVKNNPVFLCALILLLLLTAGYVNILLRINFTDLINLSKAFREEYDFLVSDKFFLKCPDQVPFFEDIQKRFFRRLRFLLRITDTYFLILNIANILLFCYIFYLLKMPFMAIVIIALALLLILSLVRIFLLDEKEE